MTDRPMPPLRPPQDRLCTETTAGGERCANWARRGESTCWSHDPEERCAAHITGGTTDQHRAGERCLNRRIPGGAVCEFHGGASPNARKAAQDRLAEQAARKIMETYGGKIEISATQALYDEVCWTAGHVQWLRERVQAIQAAHADSFEDPDGTVRGDGSRHPLVWGITKIKEGGEDAGITEEAAPSVWLQLYWKERDHLVKVSTAAVKAGLDERMVRLAENQGRLVAEMLRAILGDLELTEEQHARALEVVPRHLRALSA
jgi:hypothetical protein